MCFGSDSAGSIANNAVNTASTQAASIFPAESTQAASTVPADSTTPITSSLLGSVTKALASGQAGDLTSRFGATAPTGTGTADTTQTSPTPTTGAAATSPFLDPMGAGSLPPPAKTSPSSLAGYALPLSTWFAPT